MPTHWSVTDNAPACNRSQTHWRTVTCPGAEYLNAKQSDPMKYCSRCAKAARLALAAESAPKPLDAVWPKPRPISEAPKDGCILGWVPATDEFRAGWELLHYSVSATEWHDNVGDAHEPTHFLPLPPEVR